MSISIPTLKSIIGLPKWVIALLVAFVLLIGWFMFSKGATGDPLSMNEVMTYEADGLFIFKFQAEKSFDVEWQLVSGRCSQKPVSGYQKFYFYVADFTGTFKLGFLINKDNLTIFKDAGNCNQTEHYIAGQQYIGYLVDGNNLIAPTDDVATIKADRLRDIDEEPSITPSSVFLSAQEDGGTQWTQNFYLSYPPTINITQPTDGSQLTSAFDMTITYSNAGDFERLMIIFEDWDASSTCPIYGTEEWETEYSLYFNYQSLPYFSPFFATSTGTTTISVSDLTPHTFKCTRCYMISESIGEISDELCPEYNIDVLAYIPPSDLPSYYFPISDWTTYYAEHTEKWASSTELFTNWANAVDPMMSWIGNLAVSFQGIFNASSSAEKGTQYGNAIPMARGYLATIDNFFGGLPVSTAFLFYLITALVVIIFKMISSFINLIKP
jgi:hypothetical protein